MKWSLRSLTGQTTTVLLLRTDYSWNKCVLNYLEFIPKVGPITKHYKYQIIDYFSAKYINREGVGTSKITSSKGQNIESLINLIRTSKVKRSERQKYFQNVESLICLIFKLSTTYGISTYGILASILNLKKTFLTCLNLT